MHTGAAISLTPLRNYYEVVLPGFVSILILTVVEMQTAYCY